MMGMLVICIERQLVNEHKLPSSNIGGHVSRKNVINAIASDIISKQVEKPMLVAVTGITASGKTNLANELHKALLTFGINSFRASIDNFHNPSELRNSPHKENWLSYYEDAHDYKAFEEKLLIPLSVKGNLKYQLASLDLEKDTNISPEQIQAVENAAYIVDGTFLFKPELNHYWAYKIFVQTDFEIAIERGVERDYKSLGGKEKAEERYLSRYHKACRHYLNMVKPAENADVIVSNNKINEPKLKFQIHENRLS